MSEIEPTKAERERQAHTPGPWTCVFSELGGYDSMTDAWFINASGREIATLDLADYGQVCGVPDDSEVETATAEANARLMAAAPELLAACKAVIESGTADYECRLDDAWPLMVAAIAKAEGR